MNKDTNPYSPPFVDSIGSPELAEPIVLKGKLTPKMQDEVSERLSPKQLFGMKFYSVTLIAACATIVYLEFGRQRHSNPVPIALVNSITTHWYIPIGLSLFLGLFVWAYFAKKSRKDIEQEFVFDNSSLGIKNKDMSVELSWQSIGTVEHDDKYILIKLASPHSGTLLLCRDWCRWDHDWDTICSYLKQRQIQNRRITMR